MRRIVLSIALLVFVAVEANAKRVTLRCSRGYSITVEVSLRYPGGDIHTFEMTCPPTQRVRVPDGYEEIHAEGNMQGPNGFDEDFELPTADDNPAGSNGGWAPWVDGVRKSYQSNGPVSANTHWVPDPLAPAFLQAGEMLLSDFDDGASYGLTVALIESGSGAAVSGAQVELIDIADGSVAATGTSDASGLMTTSLVAGNEYFIRTSGAGYSTQVSDEFAMLTDHMWTMVLTPAPATPAPPTSSTGIPIWAILLLLAIVLVLVFLMRARRP